MPQKIREKKKSNDYAIILAVSIMAISVLLVYAAIKKQDYSKIVSNQSTLITTQAQVSENHEATMTTQPQIALNPEFKNDLPSETIQKILLPLVGLDYQDNLLTYQSDIVNAIDAAAQTPETLGYLFFPKSVVHQHNLENIEQLDIPLLLQKNPAWSHLPYGSDGSRELGENGCAILTLTMLQAYFTQNDQITPQDILDWSNNRYYLHNQGTSWNIFYDFAIANNYEFNNYGSDFYAAMNAVAQGKPVVASVSPGHFTEVGHILIIRGYKDGMVYVNDPNDNPKKMNSLQPIPEAIFLAEGVNYWSFSH